MVLELRSVSKSYGSALVLRDVDLTIPQGAMVALTGRSGSGKSTLFKLMAGLDRPTSGEILLEGARLSDLDDVALSRARLERLGLVFQSFNLLPDLDVLHNVRLPMDLKGMARADATARAQALLAQLEMSEHASKRPHELSGGQAQRVAIARALANAPAILLADEPTGSLDQASAQNVIAAFEAVNRAGTTVVIVSHDPLVIDRIPHRLAMEDGRAVWRTAPPSTVGRTTAA